MSLHNLANAIEVAAAGGGSRWTRRIERVIRRVFILDPEARASAQELVDRVSSEGGDGEEKKQDVVEEGDVVNPLRALGEATATMIMKRIERRRFHHSPVGDNYH